jgi:AhpD family alkylhydroperoxidase
MGLDIRTRELIAVGASVAANCQACLQYHFDKTRENGVEPQEIAEAIEVGRAVGKGAAVSMKKFASTLTAASPSPANPILPGCGCTS